jgi:UPF0755 protein
MQITSKVKTLLKSVCNVLCDKINIKYVVISLIAIVVFSLAILGRIAYLILAPLPMPEVVVRINPGESTRVISYKLKDNNVIRSAFWFDILARLSKCDRKLKAGRYVFGGNSSIWQTIVKIRDGRSTMLHLTFPEGLSLYKTLKIIEQNGISTYDSLKAIATNPEVTARLTGQRLASLEGFLYPETYAFDIDIKPEQLLELMTQQFFARLEKAEIVFEDKQDFYQKLILASIVEKEAVHEDEKPIIASVYQNRLKKKMRLESCPTVDYLLETQGIKRKKLLYEDLQINSAYNTYVVSGLPPTPICNPSISTIQAVLQPQKTDYLYFFADFEGRNVFSKTYKEHLNKQKTLQN